MRHPYEKYVRIELLSIVIAVFIGIFGLMKGYLILIFLSLYLIALSLICEAFIELSCHRQTQAGKQFIRGVFLLILVTYFFLKG